MTPPSQRREDCRIASDPWRFTVLFDENRIQHQGWEIAAMLEKECGVVAETATHNAVVFAAGIGTTMEHAGRFTQGFEWLLERIFITSSQPSGEGLKGHEAETGMDVLRCSVASPEAHAYPPTVLTPRDALQASTMAVSASEVVGRISGELICPYPPGIPFVYPGEAIDHETLQRLQAVVAAGGKVVGAADGTLATFRVVQ
jgi:arginine/lysine/ornithine decarboxylase